MQRAYLFTLLLSVLLLAGCVHSQNLADRETPADFTDTNTANGVNTKSSQDEDGTFLFETPKKSAHYESNTPAHGTILPAAPLNVVIDVNFDLVPGSKISIMNEGVDYATGETTIDDNLLAMRRTMAADAPNGLYTVEYSACWPDGSCHEGMFQFAIDQTVVEDYKDLRGKTEVTIAMEEIAFQQKQIRIDSGATVTWINNDAVTHYVNTDSHPAHTYYENQNSGALEEGEEYQITFNTRGVYLYHCSAHADTMVGSILVE